MFENSNNDTKCIINSSTVMQNHYASVQVCSSFKGYCHSSVENKSLSAVTMNFYAEFIVTT